MTTVLIPGGAFTIRQRSDGNYVLSFGNVVIAAESTYEAAFERIFSGNTNVQPWDDLTNKQELYESLNEIPLEDKA